MTLNNGLIGHWSPTLNPVKSGFTLDDLTGNGNHVSLSAGWGWFSDTDGNGTHALSAAANTDIGTIADTLILAGTSPLTVSAWVKATSTSSAGAILSRGGGASLNLYVNDGVGGYFPRIDVTASNGAQFAFAASQSLDTWVHQVCVWDGSQLYVVANTVKGSPVTADSPLLYASGEWRWGSVQSQNSAYSGFLDSIRLYDRALTDQEVTDLFNAGRGEDGIGGPDPPENTVAPAISGTTQVGQTLSTTNGSWNNGVDSYAYQWQSGTQAGGGDMADIPGATANTYLLTAGELNDYVRCVVTATNVGGSTAANSNIVGPITEGAPTFNPAWAAQSNRTIQSLAR